MKIEIKSKIKTGAGTSFNFHFNFHFNYFTLLSRNTIKYIQSLRQKKFRQKYANFFVEGTKSVVEILQYRTFEIERIYARSEFIEAHKDVLLPYQSTVQLVSEKELQRISHLKTAHQVLCICKIPQYTIKPQVVNNTLTLYLDGIQDPGNMGSILRIADWFGLPYVWCSPECVEVYNPKVLQATMGAFLRVATISMEFDTLCKEYPDLPIFASVLNGSNVFANAYPKNGIIVLGNEGNGIRSAIIDKATYRITIPKGKNGGAESLNVAVATGILCSALCNSVNNG